MEEKYKELQRKREERIDAELSQITDEEQRFVTKRYKGLGGSDMAKVLGCSKYGTAHSLWLTKTYRKQEKVDPLSSKAYLFAFGHADEGVIADVYAKQTGTEVREAGEVRMPGHEFLVANFDRLVCDPASPENAKRFLGGLECKTCENNSKVLHNGIYRDKWGAGNVYNGTTLTAIDSNIDPEYIPQVQFYLMVSGLPWWDVAVAIGRSDIRIFRVYPDKELQQDMLTKATAFWCHNVLDDVPPEMVYSDAAAETVTEKEDIEASAELMQAAEKYREITVRIKQDEAEQDKLKDTIARLMGKATKATYVNGEGKVKALVSFSLSGTTTRFDTAAFEAAEPELYKRYLKTAPKARTMRIY